MTAAGAPVPISPAEMAVFDGMLPPKLTPDMQDLARCLFEALVLLDERHGSPAPDAAWRQQLGQMARTALAQLQHLADQMGGSPYYLAKGVAVHLSARDLRMCAEFRGDYKVLAKKYKLTDMRVRQIVNAWQRQQYLARQGALPGLG
jgi:hypothetical protein